MLLTILQYPDPFLLRPSEEVVVFDQGIKDTVRDMFETHYAQENCAGLAAPQLGVKWRITVIDFSENKNAPLCLINPKITKRSESMTYEEEGCMSVPGVVAKVKRHSLIDVEYQDEMGKVHVMKEVEGFMARCIQHELDHLDGVMFMDRLTGLKRAMVLQKLSKRRRIL